MTIHYHTRCWQIALDSMRAPVVPSLAKAERRRFSRIRKARDELNALRARQGQGIALSRRQEREMAELEDRLKALRFVEPEQV